MHCSFITSANKNLKQKREQIEAEKMSDVKFCGFERIQDSSDDIWDDLERHNLITETTIMVTI